MDENYEASVDERLKRLMVATRGRSLTADDLRVTILSRDCYTPINDGRLERAGESPQFFSKSLSASINFPHSEQKHLRLNSMTGTYFKCMTDLARSMLPG